VGLIQAGLFLPQGDANLDDLIVTRVWIVFTIYNVILIPQLAYNAGEILEIGAFWSIRAKDVPSFDRYFSQLQTFYNDFRCVTEFNRNSILDEPNMKSTHQLHPPSIAKTIPCSGT
jgi:26S proteasome regulatory subunit N12